MKYLVLFFLCVFSFVAKSQVKTESNNKTNSKKNSQKSPEKRKKIDEGQMKTYYMVFLVAGDNRLQDSVTAAKIQKEHLEHLTKMWNEGKMDIAGPFLDEGDAKGICVYNVKTLEEAKQLAESDPAVKSGRLKVIVRPWMSMKGAILK